MTLTAVYGLVNGGRTKSIPVILLPLKQFDAYVSAQTVAIRHWLESHHFAFEVGRSLLVPTADGSPDHVVLCVANRLDAWAVASLPLKLPDALYSLDFRYVPDVEKNSSLVVHLAYGWGMACYRFAHFKSFETVLPRLRVMVRAHYDEAMILLASAYLARDLINLPANHLGPTQLLDHAEAIAKEFGAKYQRIQGDALLKKNYPAVHAVGRASDNPPGIIDMQWGDAAHPKVTLVGKGVCFDSGGLDIKGAQNMRLMKKDMGGAAVVLALARLVMAMQLPVRLRVLIPAVENSISSNAFRPGDIIATRKGVSVEIGNTDAEGRLILCDALAEADTDAPDLMIDCATLTGAARVALGTEVPAFFTNSDALAESIEVASRDEQELLWRLPLYAPYEDMLESKVADLSNSPESPYGGAIAAALFLNRFVEKTTHWVHVDLMAWNVKPRHGRPVGGEAQAMRTLFAVIQQKANSLAKPTKRPSKK
ncbi:MAG: leucyl aminopeptidase family protein [Rickettsiales bacterium]|nr:leucyl aminopeptidase family protein [Rickettsiales bacterium]